MKIEVGGQIQGISLSSFLQIVQMDKTSCTLKIYSNDEVGYLWLVDGNLVAAEAGSIHGLDAVYDIICWNDTVIVIDSAPAPEQNISTPLMSILMEGLRLRDEKAAQEQEAEEASPAFPGQKQSIDDQIAMQFVMEDKPDLPDKIEDLPPVSGQVPTTGPTPPGPQATPSPQPLHPAVAQDLEDDAGKAMDDDGSWLYEYEDEETQEPSNPIRKILIAFLLFLVIAGGAFGGYIWYRAHTLEVEFNTLMTELTAMKDFQQQRDLLENYLDARVINRFTMQVTERLNEANALLELDKRIEAMPRDGDFIGTSVGLYKEYLRAHRGTPFMTAIRIKMKSLPAQLDDLDYKRIREAESKSVQVRLGLYRSYLNDHSNGKYVREVSNLVASVSDEYYLSIKEKVSSCYKKKDWTPCIAVADTFTAEFPEDSRFNEIWLLRGEMIEQGQLQEMRRQAQKLSYADTRNMYIAYLQKNPHSTIEAELRKEIAALSKKAEQQGQWREVKEIADNPKKPINIRIREVELYIERYPDGAFIKDARKKKSSLESQKSRLLKEEKATRENLRAQQAEKRRIEEQQRTLKRQQQAEAENRRKRELAARIRAREASVRALLLGKESRFVDHNNGTITDTQSGLTWVMLDSKNTGTSCMTFKKARAWVDALKTGGFTDWRLPTANELALLYNGKPYYPTSGAPWYWTAELETGAWGTSTEAFTFDPNNKETFKREAHPLTKCGYVHAVRTP